MKLPELTSKKFYLVFAAASLLLLLIKLKTFFNFYDEGFALVDATRVLHGQVPYKDFWALYPPGQFYAIAAAMKLFGTDLIVSRLYDTLIRFVAVLGVLELARRVTSTRMAYLAAGLTAFILASAGFYSYAVFPALAFGIWGFALWLIYLDDRRRRWLYLSGLSLGLSILFRWDIGLYAAFGLLLSAYLYWVLPAFLPDSGQPSEPGKKDLFAVLVRAPLAVLGWVVLPMLLIALLGYGIVAARGGLGAMIDQLITFPATIFHSVRWLPYPSLVPSDFIQTVQVYDFTIPYLNPPSEDWQRFYLPLLTDGLALAGLLFVAVKSRLRLARKHYVLFGLLLFGLLLFNQALSRYDQIHVTPASILTCILAVSLFSLFTTPAKTDWIKVGLSALLILLTALYFVPALKDLLSTLDGAAPWGCYSHLPKASCAGLSPDEAQAVEEMAFLSKPGELIFVGNLRHDKIFVNDPGFYYLVDRLPGTRYHELHPGVATTLPIQTEIASQLEANQVQWAVLVKMWESNEPNGSAESSGVTYLDDYLRAHYEYKLEFGMYQIWKRIEK